MRERSSDSGFDVVVIGAGVIGLSIAAALGQPGRSVLVLEREPAIARGITSRNSEVVHAGIYYPAESAKAELCVRGRELLYSWCLEKRVDAKRVGKLIVATRVEEEAILDELLARGVGNGVTGLELIDAKEVSRLEPAVAARRALRSRETGIVDGHGLCLSLLAAAESQGVVLSVASRVRGIESRAHGWCLDVEADSGRVERIDAGLVVDAAGLEADRIAALAGLDVERLGWRQHPCKGDYFSLAASSGIDLRHLIYPVPQEAGLGIHATVDLANRIRFGPDVRYVDSIDFDVDPRKAADFQRAVARYLPDLAERDLQPDYAGIRPKLAGPGEGFRDFVVEECSEHGAHGFVACIGIESPGLTASLALAERVAGWVSG